MLGRTALGAIFATCAALLVVTPATATMNLPSPTFTKAAEGFGSVAPFACYPSLRPGSQAFAELIKAASGYGYGGWRPCDATWGIPQSQHKTGRAVDVFIDYRQSTARADGTALLTWLFQNSAERLRRLGVVEIIWAGKIWTTADDQGRLTANVANWRTYTGLGCPGAYDPTNCHYDHFHFTLSVAGSDKTSTWWTAQGSALRPGQDTVGVVNVSADGAVKSWHPSNDNVHPATTGLYGRPSDVAVTGDWDGNGVDTYGVVVAQADGTLMWYLSNDNVHTAVTRGYGRTGDVPVTGDWDGDGDDNIGVVNTTTDGYKWWHLDHMNGVYRQPVFGRPSDVAVTGDWDGQ